MILIEAENMSEINDLATQAINQALSGNWSQARDLNLQILKVESDNLPALLRLAKAYTNLNQLLQAKKAYHKILRLDKYNPIAKRNMARLQKLKKGDVIKDASEPTTPLFLEEPGKTKSVFLIRLTDERKLATLSIGQKVELVVNPKSVSATRNGQYIGRLPDDLAFRLIKLIRSGNAYEAFIRLVEKDKLQIFIRETKRAKRNEQVLSFPPKNDQGQDYHPFLPIQMLGEEIPLVMKQEETDEESSDED
jgi:hypothetical protein